MQIVERRLGTVDYVCFALVFMLSSVIGFYHAYKDRNKTHPGDFHLSGRRMHPVPVSLSLAATFMSAVTLLGNPTEIYTHGTMFYWILAGMLFATIGSAHIFIPMFYKMNKISCFEYIRLRFGKCVQLLASAIFLAQTLMYMGMVLYAPSLAFGAVTGISLYGTMAVVSFVCSLYTMLGGMKTVLWTDTLQMGIMVAGLIAVLIQACRNTGGFANAWKLANEFGRIEFLNISMDPRTRHSIWTLAIGGGIHWTYLYGVNQAQVQRACSLPSLKRAQLAIWLNFPCLVVIVSLTCMIGVVMFAFYHECDPVKSGVIDKTDQMLPLMVLEVMHDIPGVTGLFVACVFSGSLSTISSGLNAMSAVLVEDFVKLMCCETIDDRREIIMSKIFVLVFGVIQFGIAVLISLLGGLILQLSYSMFSIMAGPLLGLFISGLIFPWTNRIGASVGLVTSLVILSWLSFGTVINKPSPITAPLETYTFSCYINQTTTNQQVISTEAFKTVTNYTGEVDDVLEENIFTDFYRMSYMWYTGFGMLVQLITALLVSFMTGHTRPRDVDSELMIPLFYNLMPCLPEKYRRWLKFGVDYSPMLGKSDMGGIGNEGYIQDMTHL